MTTIIDKLIERHQQITASLETQNEVSLRSYADDEFRKVLVLSIASYFEHQIVDAVSRLAESAKSEQVENLIKSKAIARQYHTYFDWESRNANRFLSLFGSKFKNDVSTEIRADRFLEEGCESFLTLGRTRNRLVHENFAEFSLDYALEDIVEQYGRALSFVAYLSERVQPQNNSLQ
jgi:hypothetical protein